MAEQCSTSTPANSFGAWLNSGQDIFKKMQELEARSAQLTAKSLTLTNENQELKRKLDAEVLIHTRLQQCHREVRADYEKTLKELDDRKEDNHKLGEILKQSKEAEESAQQKIEELQKQLEIQEMQLSSRLPPKTLKFAKSYMKIFGEKATYYGSSTCYLCYKVKRNPEAARRCAYSHAGLYPDENGKMPYLTDEHEMKVEKFLRAQYKATFGVEPGEGECGSPRPGPSRGGSIIFKMKESGKELAGKRRHASPYTRTETCVLYPTSDGSSND